jgi:hypothetical protein
LIANHGEKDVAVANSVGEILSEIHSKRNPVHIHEDIFIAESGFQFVEYDVRRVRGILTAIRYENFGHDQTTLSDLQETSSCMVSGEESPA